MLRYPFTETPELGQSISVAPGVQWLRIPLPASIKNINVWVIDEGERIAIVDTGMSAPESVAAWRAAFAGPLARRQVSRVVATHLHPDHIGLAGLFTRRYDCRLWITRLEYFSCRSLAADTGREAPADAIRFYRAAGWNEDDLEHYRSRFGAFGKALHPLPDSFVGIADGDEIRIGEHIWRVVVGSGHSPEHACLYCPELALFISGDQILPRISSNVAVYPTEPEANPLDDWITSLTRIKQQVPADVLVLPAHRDPFHGLHERIDELVSGHRRDLGTLTEHLEQPRRVIDCFAALYSRPIDDGNRLLATGECLAHLNYLIAQGIVRRDVDDTDIAWYRKI